MTLQNASINIEFETAAKRNLAVNMLRQSMRSLVTNSVKHTMCSWGAHHGFISLKGHVTPAKRDLEPACTPKAAALRHAAASFASNT